MVTEITMEDMMEPLPYQDNIIRVVMFYGPSCGPCKATMPHYETVSTLFETLPVTVNFFKINAWEPAEQREFVSTMYQISGVPHFKAFFRGAQILEKVGGGDEETMKKFVYDILEEIFKQHGSKLHEG